MQFVPFLEMPTAVENTGMSTSEEKLPVNGSFSASGSVSPVDEVRRICMQRCQNMFNGSPLHSSKCINVSTHYLGDKQDFDVSSEGPSSGITN